MFDSDRRNTPRVHGALHADWAAESLWQQLLPWLPGLSVEVVARCDSTNTRLLERVRLAGSARQSDPGNPALPGSAPAARGRRSGDVEPALLVAEQQTSGRGRMGRDWQAGAGVSLTFSLALPLAPHSWQGLSLAVGLALAEALEPLRAGRAPRLQLKWPNDLWLCDAPGRGRKLGGVLIETVGMGTGAGPDDSAQRMAVVGVGLNVLPQDLHGLSSGYACLQELLPDISAPRVLHRVAAPLVRALLDFQTQGFAPLAAAYAQRDLLRGQTVSTTLAELPLGVAEGVDDDGALRVRAGTLLQRVSSGEVSIRLQPGEAPPC
jgi:BirA family biotin operon repressor/biotin-[acetyl-CoA-carboxylase] ligase